MMSRRLCWALIALASLMAVIIGSCLTVRTMRDAPDALTEGDARRELAAAAALVSGEVVYERDGGIWKATVGRLEPVRLTDEGTYPRWSPDGEYVVFVRGQSILRMTSDGSDEEVIATTGSPRAVATHPNGNEILFTDGDTVKAVALDSREVKTVWKGHRFAEIDISSSGIRSSSWRISVPFPTPEGPVITKTLAGTVR